MNGNARPPKRSDDLQRDAFAGNTGELVVAAQLVEQFFSQVTKNRRARERRIIEFYAAIGKISQPRLLGREDDLPRAIRPKLL